MGGWARELGQGVGATGRRGKQPPVSDDREPMDVPAVLEKLNEALRMQYRSVLAYALAAGTVTGVDGLGFGDTCRRFAAHELDDLARLAEKIVVLGGEPPTDVAPMTWTGDTQGMTRTIVDCEQDALAQLHAVIADSGQEPRSEALEHLIEHLIIRKQEQIDRFLRVLGDTEEEGRPAEA